MLRLSRPQDQHTATCGHHQRLAGDNMLYTLAQAIHQITQLVQDTDGDWLPGDSFEGLAGEIQAVLLDTVDPFEQRGA